MKLENLPGCIAVVCHDAGGANLILALINTLHFDKHEIRPLMAGPAAALWKRRYPDLPTYSQLEQAIDGAELVLTGTGWASDLEHNARQMASSRGIYSIAMLDHWVNYKDRFVRAETIVLPDEIWVSDIEAKEIVHTIFDDLNIEQIPNFYMQEQLALLSVNTNVKPEVLYVLEPARNNWGRDLPGEFQALDYFIDNLEKLKLPKETVIRIRPHPSDPSDKYLEWISAHASMHVVADDSLDMSSALSRSNWVVGCETYALVLALAANRQAYCSLPPWAPSCRLPHKGLIHLKDLR